MTRFLAQCPFTVQNLLIESHTMRIALFRKSSSSRLLPFHVKRPSQVPSSRHSALSLSPFIVGTTSLLSIFRFPQAQNSSSLLPAHLFCQVISKSRESQIAYKSGRCLSLQQRQMLLLPRHRPHIPPNNRWRRHGQEEDRASLEHIRLPHCGVAKCSSSES